MGLTPNCDAASGDWIGPDEREERLIEQFAKDMHARTSGDWAAAGWITQQAFRGAAVDAVRQLNMAGFDLLDILPRGAQGRVLTILALPRVGW